MSVPLDSTNVNSSHWTELPCLRIQLVGERHLVTALVYKMHGLVKKAHGDMLCRAGPQELKSIIGSGLLSFPLTDFDTNGDFNAKGYAERLKWLAPYGASALFAAGVTGEFFSLTADDYPAIIQTAVNT
jgi:hypothetical protein